MNRIKKLGKVLSLFFITAAISGCNFYKSFDDDKDDDIVAITSLTMSKQNLNLKAGGAPDYITIKVNPAGAQKDCRFTWSYDKSIIKCEATNFGVTVTPLKEGYTTLQVSYGGYSASCLVTVESNPDYESEPEPYIYSSTTILTLTPGQTEKVNVSLYGGDASDVNGYTWLSEANDIATVQPTGQYAMITAKQGGYASIKVTHRKSKYPYYMGVYVYEDPTNIAYITTDTNILTLDESKGEQNISVRLVNGKDTSLDSMFKWELVKVDNGELPVDLNYNGNNAVVTPKRSGTCKIRIKHDDALYPLDIVCRVITYVKNVYIQPDRTQVNIVGDKQETVTCTLENIDVGEYSIDEFDFMTDNPTCADVVDKIGNQVIIKGYGNGSTKLKCIHPKAKYPREVLLIVTGQMKDAVDASFYITTTQNYIRTKVGADPTKLRVSLRGGEEGDERDFVWDVKNTPKDGMSDVIRLSTTHGVVNPATMSSSRAVSDTSTYAFGEAEITPNAEGTAVITVSHKKVHYTTEILVTVLNKYAVLKDPLYFTGSGLVKVINGETYNYKVNLNGNNKEGSDDSKIKWASMDESRVTVNGSGTEAAITPKAGIGQNITKINVSHERVDVPKEVLVMSADTEEDLKKMKALYTDKNYYNFEVNSEVYVQCNAVGWEDEDSETDYDYSMTEWVIEHPEIISIERSSGNPLVCTAKGLRAGTTKLTARFDGKSCEYTMTVLPEGSDYTDPAVYFTTGQNVVSLKGEGAAENVRVTAVNLDTSEYSEIQWAVDKENIATIIPNGTSCEIQAHEEGTAIVTVTHEKSQNVLKIYVRVGSEYEVPAEKPVVYISAPDVLTMLRGEEHGTELKATLVNYEGSNSKGFRFEIDDGSVAEITSQNVDGTAWVKGVGSGQAQITVTHPAAGELDKKVLVVVGNSAEELAGFKYLTTDSNVVAVGQGRSKTISVSVKHAENPVLDGYIWSTSNREVCDIEASGSSALIKGNKIGTAIVKVKNPSECQYDLDIIVQVVDPVAASKNPFIQLSSSVLTLTEGDGYKDVTAELIGGEDGDEADFTWESNDSSVCLAYCEHGVGKLKPMNEGQTYIKVGHPRARSAQLLVVVDKKKTAECYIEVPQSNITMKPTDSATEITASLIGGSSTDKYGFKWNLDVYDIVELQKSANTVTITPLQTGKCTLTIHHDKAAFDQIVNIKVEEYSDFKFPQDSIKLTQGDVKFMGMQVPVANVSSYIRYTTDNEKICSIVGTNATAQITAISPGTTTVKAELVASGSGIVQSHHEMMVYVEKAKTNVTYITAGTVNYTVNKDKTQTLQASLVGGDILPNDQQNLSWFTSDTDIVKILGTDSTGKIKNQSIVIQALKPGEAVIKCSHEKAESDLQFLVIVPGHGDKVITLDKTYISMTNNGSGQTLKASIENAESGDYNKLIWTVENPDGADIARIGGNGKSVQVFPVKAGNCSVMCQLPDSTSYAKCDVRVVAANSLKLDKSAQKVQPKHSKFINYTVSPVDAILEFNNASDDDYFDYRDLGHDKDGKGQIEIIGLKEGNGTLYATINDGAAKATLAVRVNWDYEFSLQEVGSYLKLEPFSPKSFNYKVSPVDADIKIECPNTTDFDFTTVHNDDGTGTVTVTSTHEINGESRMVIKASNPNNNDEEIGSKSIQLTSKYDQIHIVPRYISSTGNFSSLDVNSNLITLGDGETVYIGLDTKEKGINIEFNEIKMVNPGPGVGNATVAIQESMKKNDESSAFSVYYQGDTKVDVYRIKSYKYPAYKGKEIDNWEKNLTWKVSENVPVSNDCCNFMWLNDNSGSGAGLYKAEYFISVSDTATPNFNAFFGFYIVGESDNGWGKRCFAGGNKYKSQTHGNSDPITYLYSNFVWGYNTAAKEGYSSKWIGREFSSLNELENIPWFCIPSSINLKKLNKHCEYWSSDGELIENRIIREHVTLDRITTKNKSVVDVKEFAVQVKYTHNFAGKQETIQFPVRYEIRNCSMNQN